MTNKKKTKLKELGISRLLLEFQIATRKAWEIFQKQPQKVALKSPERREEMRVRREVTRRLKYESIRGATQAKALEAGDKFLFLEGRDEDSSVVYLCRGRSEGGEVFSSALANGDSPTFHPDHYVFKLRM